MSNLTIKISPTPVWVLRRTKSKKYLACCDLLNLVTIGDSIDETIELIRESTCIFFEVLIEDGVFHKFLEEHNLISVPAMIGREFDKLNVNYDITKINICERCGDTGEYYDWADRDPIEGFKMAFLKKCDCGK